MRLFRKSRSARRPKVLLAWETGAGFTHVQNALGIVAHLAGNGADCIFAAADPRFDAWFRGHGARIVQTWLWPAMRIGAATPPPREARVFTDILANYGALDPAHLSAAIAHYDTLFDLAQPDILLCENAFAAQLAARGRVPTIVFGSTLLFMPPVVGDSLAPIDPEYPTAVWPEEDVMDALNAALAASARPPLSCAADLMDCAAILPFGPAAFDPYAHARAEPVLAPYCPDLPLGRDAAGRREIVVYLHESTQFVEPIMAALLRLPAPVRLYIPALSDHLRAAFAEAGFIVENRMMAMETIADRAACLIHHGGVTLTGAALALGVPQVVLARFYENALAGRFVAGRALGAWAPANEVDGDWLSGAVDAIRHDPAAAARGAAASPEFQRWFDGDPTFVVARRAAAILGMGELQSNPARGHRDLAPV